MASTIQSGSEYRDERVIRRKSFLPEKNVIENISYEEWKLEEIKKGIKEVQKGQYVDHNTIVNYWKKKNGTILDKARKK